MTRIRLIFGAAMMTLGCARHGTYYHAPSIEGVRFFAQAELVSGSADSLVRVSVRAVNTARVPRELQYGLSCNLSARLTTAALKGDRRPPHTWDYEALEDARARAVGLHRVCLASMISQRLSSGDSASPLFVLTFSTRDVLADSLPAGRYRVTAIAVLAGELPAGEVSLRVPPT